MAISAKAIRFVHIAESCNPADLLSKHWDNASVRKILKPFLFFEFEGTTSPVPPITAIKAYAKTVLDDKRELAEVTKGSDTGLIPPTTQR